jgi:integrase
LRHADLGSGTLVQFALGTGMLMGQILSLSWRAVDLIRRTAMVFQSKNGEHRTIPLNQTVLNLITGRGTIRSLSTDQLFQ